MIVPYYRSSVLLRAIAAVLDLQFQCTATALSFLHKFHSMAPAGTRDQNVRCRQWLLLLMLREAEIYV